MSVPRRQRGGSSARRRASFSSMPMACSFTGVPSTTISIRATPIMSRILARRSLSFWPERHFVELRLRVLAAPSNLFITSCLRPYDFKLAFRSCPAREDGRDRTALGQFNIPERTTARFEVDHSGSFVRTFQPRQERLVDHE